MKLRIPIAWTVSFFESIWFFNSVPRGDAPVPPFFYYTILPAMLGTILFAVAAPLGWLLLRPLLVRRLSRAWVLPVLVMTLGVVLTSQTWSYARSARCNACEEFMR